MLLSEENFDYCNGILRMYSNVESDGDLATFIKNTKKKGDLLDEKIILTWFLMLVMGIQALHSKSVLHRDLKSANIFLTSKKFIKIGDFGISKVLDSTSAKTFVGTPYYLSPEVCSNKKYDLRSDLWSLGCILYELCTLNVLLQLFSTLFMLTTFLV
jgi:NIMA (never in mitosis gene a)-related kinase